MEYNFFADQSSSFQNLTKRRSSKIKVTENALQFCHIFYFSRYSSTKYIVHSQSELFRPLTWMNKYNQQQQLTGGIYHISYLVAISIHAHLLSNKHVYETVRHQVKENERHVCAVVDFVHIVISGIWNPTDKYGWLRNAFPLDFYS